MKRKLKYIRFETGFVIFSEPMAHSEVEVRKTEKLISAGFCYPVVDMQGDPEIVWTCYGESVSLNLKSNPEDSKLLTKQMNGEW